MRIETMVIFLVTSASFYVTAKTGSRIKSTIHYCFQERHLLQVAGISSIFHSPHLMTSQINVQNKQKNEQNEVTLKW